MIERAFVATGDRGPDQLDLLEGPRLEEAASSAEPRHGVVFTRPWVVDLILDLVGYTDDRCLADATAVEPSCGDGSFLSGLVDRLVRSARAEERGFDELDGAIRAFDLLEANVSMARARAKAQLLWGGADEETAVQLSRSWVSQGDFLLDDLGLSNVDYVVGNPPYVRLEKVPPETMGAYRRAWPTMRGRSDLYVGFIERGLSLLRPDGVLGYICADRWMRNQYGARLRELIAASFSVEAVVTMHDVDAFEQAVAAYPATIILRNRSQGRPAIVSANVGFGATDAPRVVSWMHRSTKRAIAGETFEGSRLDRWFSGRDLWPSGSPRELALIADMEARLPPLQDRETETRVGIGVATGCDDIYITRDHDLVEQDRLLPLLRAADTVGGRAEWSGAYLVNPWNGHGLVDLDGYPRLRTYVIENAARLRGRHVAQRLPDQWYRTIDRVDQNLVARPKLLIPDLKARAHPVLDEGGFYPHHNLYFVVSGTWDPEVLGGILLSDVANMFVGAYCVRMRGGCYRFQAQYLRRIRVPRRESVAVADRKALVRAFRDRDAEAATATSWRVYGLDVSSQP